MCTLFTVTVEPLATDIDVDTDTDTGCCEFSVLAGKSESEPDKPNTNTGHMHAVTILLSYYNATKGSHNAPEPVNLACEPGRRLE